MFYRPKEQPTDSPRRHLKAQLEERLRTALEFATLGAYVESDAQPSAHRPAPRDPQTRVFLFAKVSPPCPHSPVVTRACEHGASGPAVGGGAAIATRRRSRRSRRGGTAEAPPQPCTWAAEPRS